MTFHQLPRTRETPTIIDLLSLSLSLCAEFGGLVSAADGFFFLVRWELRAELASVFKQSTTGAVLCLPVPCAFGT